MLRHAGVSVAAYSPRPTISGCLALHQSPLKAHVRRVIQSSGPIRYGIVDGIDVRDSRVHNYPPRWNAAPNDDLLVIRRNHQTGEVSLDPLRWGLIPYWCQDPKGGYRVRARSIAPHRSYYFAAGTSTSPCSARCR
jgi:putative SOS response-associated peptidase YedK